MLSKFTPKQYCTIIIFALFQICSSLDTLDETRNLTNGQTLVSSGNIFELGFFKSDVSTNWFVGIWYKVSPEIIVWVANPDHPSNQSSSTLRISKGTIVLVNPSQKIVWSSSVNSSVVNNVSSPIMQLLDSGNLVLKDPKGGNIIWQSFDYPSNTLLPGMKIGKNLNTGFEWFLTSWKSRTDPSKGNYYYRMDPVGAPKNILLYIAEIKYSTGSWNGRRFSGVPEMDTYENMFIFKLVSDVNQVYYTFEAKQGVPLSRLVLNDTGIVQRMVWDQTSQTWSEFWYGPKDPCDNYGKCGPFGICNINDVTICGCLQGFHPKSEEEWSMRNFSGGYVRKTQLSCQENDNGFYLVKGVKLPDTHKATVDPGISIEKCRNMCLMNCSCLAYSVLDIRNGGGCITWSNDLLDIRYIPGAQDIYIKTPKTDLAQIESSRRQDVIIGTSATAAILSLLIMLLAGFLYWKKFREDIIVKDVLGLLREIRLPLFDLSVLAASTNNFSSENVIGQGTFGVVYKGQLPTGVEVAVKKLKYPSDDSSRDFEEFKNEVKLIAKLKHQNVVKLLGCCIQGSTRILVYEYMIRQSLDLLIFNKDHSELLDWELRWKIIEGIAKGLLYLHKDSGENIIHRDIKAENILLDGEMIPKIADFNTARLITRGESEMATKIIIGTRGYMAPEYAMSGIYSFKSDVYSFGVLLLEIISGKRNYGNQNLVAYGNPNLVESFDSLSSYLALSIHLIAVRAYLSDSPVLTTGGQEAWKLWEEHRAIDLADEVIKNDTSCDLSELVRSVHVGLLCVQVCPNHRPTMSNVVQMLTSGSYTIPEPTKPTEWAGHSSQLALPEDQFQSTKELMVTDTED